MQKTQRFGAAAAGGGGSGARKECASAAGRSAALSSTGDGKHAAYVCLRGCSSSHARPSRLSTRTAPSAWRSTCAGAAASGHRAFRTTALADSK